MAHDDFDDHPAAGPDERGSEANLGRDSGMGPSDLQAAERDVATWCRTLERPDAPPALRQTVVASGGQASGGQASGGQASGGQASGGQAETAPAGRLLSMFPLGGWGLASAALLLVALGTATLVELTDGGREAGVSRDGLAVSDGALVHDAAAREGSTRAVRIVEDPSMALFHDVETFDEVGLVRGEVIADWGQ